MRVIIQHGAGAIAAAARRFLARRRPAHGVSTNSSHIIWAIIAVVAGVAGLVATHNLWVPWLNSAYGYITGVTPSTTTMP